jgi:hypothetical protein
MAPQDLARLCAREILDRLIAPPRMTEAERIAAVESYVQGAINRARADLVEELRPALEARVVQVETGHVSVDVGITAKGEYQYSAKVVLPFVGTADADLDEARGRAEWQLERAEAFLKSKYGRQP